MVSVTSARPRGLLAPCSPITQDRASTMLDLPEPFGPTAQVMPGSKRSVVAEAKDLKPRRVRLFRYKCRPSSRSPHDTVRRRQKWRTAARFAWRFWSGHAELADPGWGHPACEAAPLLPVRWPAETGRGQRLGAPLRRP